MSQFNIEPRRLLFHSESKRPPAPAVTPPRTLSFAETTRNSGAGHNKNSS